MNTQHLKYVIEVERTSSISHAAENLFMGQPTLSKAIKELEDNLGFTIFERNSKGVIPTAKGVKFLTYARNVLSQLDKMEALSDEVDRNAKNFSISIPRGSYIADAVTKFISKLDGNSGIYVKVQETNSMQVITNIFDGPFNLGIIRYRIEHENYFVDYLKEKQLRYEQIWEFEKLALMSVNHPFAKKDQIEYEEIQKFIEVIHGDNAIPYILPNSMRMEEPSKHDKSIHVYDRCSQYDILSEIPNTFMWVSPIPTKWLTRYKLVQRKCTVVGHRYKDVIIYPKNYKLTELDRQFIDILSETKNEVSFRDYH